MSDTLELIPRVRLAELESKLAAAEETAFEARWRSSRLPGASGTRRGPK